jgi:acetyl esterase
MIDRPNEGHGDGATANSAARHNEGMPLLLRATAPDRDARAFLRLFNLLSRRPVRSYSVRQLRLFWKLLASALGRTTPAATVTKHEIDGPAGPIDLTIFAPQLSERPLPAFIWCHGGGFLVGGPETSDSICRAIALTSGAIVVAVRYRLAPEHGLRAGREDILAALTWVAENGATLGIDPTRLAIGGDSAGGNIAAAVAQQTIRRGGPQLRLQVLAYPATELVQEFPSKAENAVGYMISSEILEHIRQTLPAIIDAEHPWLSPRRSRDLHNLPPAVIVSAGFDPIRDDGLEHAARLRAADVPVELLHYAGQFHGFLNFDALIDAGRDALARIGAALARALHDDIYDDRTIEVADARPSGAWDKGVDLANTMLMAWEAVGLWSETLPRLVSPRVGKLSGILTRPWFLPAALLRRTLVSGVDPRTARQTYPTKNAESAA